MKSFAIVACTLILTIVSSNAADWQFYGSARVQTFIEDYDAGTSTGSPNKSYVQYLQNNARLGAVVNVNEQISGRFEYGTDVDVRLLYGEWNFGKGSLLVGQAFSPLNINYSGQVWWDDTNLTDMGGIYSSRNPMIQLQFGEFKIAALEPDTIVPTTGTSSTKTDLPKIEASYRFKGGIWEIKVAGGYNGFDLTYNGALYEIDSFVLGIGGKVNAGPVLLAATFWTGENTGGYVMNNLTNNTPSLNTTAQTITDCDGYGLTLVAGYAVNETVYLEAGYGQNQSELEDDSAPSKHKLYSYYFQTRLTLTPGVYLVPEVGLVHWGTYRSGTDYGETLYYGAKWQIDF